MSPVRTEESDVKELEIPEFKSSIPHYIIDGLTANEKYMLETLSIMAQKQDFGIQCDRNYHREIQLLKKRTEKYEKLILVLSSKWSVVLGILALIYPILSTKLLEKIWP